MAKRRARKSVKQPSGNLRSNSNCTNAEEPELQKKSFHIIDPEVKRRVATCEAINDAEIEHLLTVLRLLRSTFNNERLETPVLQYFKENMPNLKISETDGQFEVEWKDKEVNLSVSHTDVHASLLQGLYPDFAAGLPPVGGFDFSMMTKDLLDAANFQLPDSVMEQPSETQMPGLQDAFRTPGANTQRLSVGVTPKTLRLPKHGEMLLSVRGSPLGMYKEDNMEAIQESEED